MKRRLFIALSAFLTLGLALGTSYLDKTSAAVPGMNTLASVSDDSTYGSNTNVADGIVSGDGNSVVFRTDASNIVTGDTNGTYDIFVRNLMTNTTTRVDVSTSGVQANYGANAAPGISRTGRYVAFGTTATNLIDGQTMTTAEVYLHDMVTGTTSLVTRTSSGVAEGCGTNGNLAVSSDGRFVLFQGYCSNAGLGVPRGDYVYMADRQLNTIQVLSTPLGGAAGNPLALASMSCDGMIVAFATADQLTSNDTDSMADVYMVDLRNGVSVTDLTSTAFSTSQSYAPYVSCNGDYVSFLSNDNSFAAAQVSSSDTHMHAYLYNRINGTYTLVDQNNSGAVGSGNAGGYYAVAAVDDRGDVVFTSGATNLSSSVTNYPYPAAGQLWLRNTTAGTTDLLSVSASGAAGYYNGGSASYDYVSISSDGKVVSYRTNATNLLSGGTITHSNTLLSQTGL